MGFYDVINWRTISVFGNSKIINRSFIYLFIVPMVAKLLTKIKSPIELSLGGEMMHLTLALPFSWKLFFFSALVFTLGAICYSLFAPSIIKENISFGDFLTDRKNFTHIYKYRDELGVNKLAMEKLGIDVHDLVRVTGGLQRAKLQYELLNISKTKFPYDKVEFFLKSQNWINALNNENRDDTLEQTFWLIFDYANTSRKVLIIITALFYLAGFIMIAIVFIQSIVEVIKWV